MSIIQQTYDRISRILYLLGFSRFEFILNVGTKIRKKIIPKFIIIDNHTFYLDEFDSLNLSFVGENRGSDFEKNEIQTAEKYIKKNDNVVDIGANIGYHALNFARMTGPNGKIFAFEPISYNFELLKKNVNKNKYENIILEQKAVLNEKKKIKLYLSTHNAGDNRIFPINKNSKFETVECISLDDYFQKFDEPISFVKIDAQGSEPFIINGMKNIIRKNKKISILMEFDPFLIQQSNYDPFVFLNELSDLGLQVFDLKHNFKIDVLKILEKKGFINILCVKSEIVPE